MLAANVMLIIGVIRVFLALGTVVAEHFRIGEGRLEGMQKLLAGLSIAAVVLLAVNRYPQMVEVHSVADVWRERIYLARKVGIEEITVPAYPQDLDARFYDLDVINSQSRYDLVSYCVVYGTHVVIGNEL